jgi:predicted anti-sigma-YlaC factor YlaD
MAVTREVIMDLLPLYLSDEASADSNALVKEHLQNDPELEKLATQWKDRLPEPPPAPVNPDAQVMAYQEAKRQIANRVITLAAAIAFGILIVGGTALIGAMLLITR